jgi:hypothetical protein
MGFLTLLVGSTVLYMENRSLKNKIESARDFQTQILNLSDMVPVEK